MQSWPGLDFAKQVETRSQRFFSCINKRRMKEDEMGTLWGQDWGKRFTRYGPKTKWILCLSFQRGLYSGVTAEQLIGMRVLKWDVLKPNSKHTAYSKNEDGRIISLPKSWRSDVWHINSFTRSPNESINQGEGGVAQGPGRCKYHTSIQKRGKSDLGKSRAVSLTPVVCKV